ncbi:unnamed protein product [Pylaiella littoralis]
MSVSLLEITASPSGSECVSVSAEGSSAVEKLPQKPLNLITIWGGARTGKSFFMNALAGVAEYDVFAVAGGSHPCTVGAFISITTRSLSDFGSESGCPTLSSSMSGMNLGAGVQPEIGFVDVEGQGDKHITYEIKLAIPLLLLSKVVLFNWSGLPNKTTMLNSLGTMREAATTIDRSQRKDVFGHLIVLLRDVAEKEEKEAYSVIFDKEDDYCITDEAEKQMDLRNVIRRDLNSSFQSIRVCCLPPPHEKINGDRQIAQGEVSPAFAAKVTKLRHLLATELVAKPHSFGNGPVVGGEVLSSLLTGVCEVVNGGLSNFVPLSLMQSIQQGRAETVLSESKNLFNQSIAIGVEDKPPLSKANTKKLIEAAASTAVGHFTGQSLAESIASKYREKLDEVIDEGSRACYAAQERQVLNAMNQVNRLRSESRLQVGKKASGILASFPMEVNELIRRWVRLCADVHGQLQSSVEQHLGSGILEDLQGALPTPQQFEDSVSDHLSNLIASNQSQLKSEQDTTILKKGLHEMKEAAAEAKNQADAMQEGIKQLRQESRKNREDEERSQMWKDLASLTMGALHASRSWTAGASGSSGETTDSGSVRTATQATAARSRPARDVDVGPIDNQEHAERKAKDYIAKHPDQEWTGHWKTTSGGTSVINVRDKA